MPNLLTVPSRAGLLLGALIVIAAPASAAAEALPCQVAETNRHAITEINLDADRAKETVDIFNVDGAESPITELMVCNRTGGELMRASLKVIWGPSPGNRESGLAASWVGNLDHADGRVEAAARNVISPSAGEQLVILRQRAKHSLTFKRLQTISGDTVTMTPRSGKPAFVTVGLKANHSPDGKAHAQRWNYRPASGRWVCAKDC